MQIAGPRRRRNGGGREAGLYVCAATLPPAMLAKKAVSRWGGEEPGLLLPGLDYERDGSATPR